jgi:hypothetical protein
MIGVFHGEWYTSQVPGPQVREQALSATSGIPAFSRAGLGRELY